jgi:hypothetical protein
MAINPHHVSLERRAGSVSGVTYDEACSQELLSVRAVLGHNLAEGGMKKHVFLALTVALLWAAGSIFRGPERYQQSGIAPFSQAPAWMLRAVGIVLALCGLLLFYRFLVA